MKNISIKFLSICLLWLGHENALFSQCSAKGDTIVGGKKIIDSSIFETTGIGDGNIWPKIEDAQLSKDGRYVSYIVKNFPALGEKEIVFQATDSSWEQSLVTTSYGLMSDDSKWAIVSMGKDSIQILRLGTNEMRTVGYMHDYQWDENRDLIAYIRTGDSSLTLFDLNTEKEQTLGQVNDFDFSPAGKKLVWERLEKDSLGKKYSLHWMNVPNGEPQKLDEDTTEYNLGGFVFDSSEIAAALVKDSSLWLYKESIPHSLMLAGPSSKSFPKDMHIRPNGIIFSQDGHRLLFDLEPPPPLAQSALSEARVQVDVWRYDDNPDQASQLQDTWPNRYYPAMINLDTRSLLYLGAGNRHFTEPGQGQPHPLKYLLYTDATGTIDYWWAKDSLPSFCLVNTSDGTSKVVKRHIDYYPECNDPMDMEFNLSPAEKYVLYYNPLKDCYYSYDINSGQSRDISRSIPVALTNHKSADNSNDPAFQHPAGIIAWLKDDKGVLVSDNYDIWLLDLSGRQAAINITGGYGRKHHIAFTIEGKRPGLDIEFNIAPDSSLLLIGFDEISKYEGFYTISLNNPSTPQEVTRGPYWYSGLKNSHNMWLFYRQSTLDYPNLFAMFNFKKTHQLTNFQPQQTYNWLSAELINYRLPDGSPCQGILYKPENLDPTKKYPVIFYYYEKLTQELFQFQEPSLPHDIINIPVFVNKGYLIFMPDIWYKVGYPGEGALQSVVAAAHVLAQRPYVDDKHMGLQGHSWGAYETYYIISHSHLFAAAVASDGPTDFISGYGSPRGSGMPPSPHLYEITQCRIGATPWERLDLYIKNSPIFRADKITTPLLMQHNKRDWLVNFDQGMELFTALRRMDKKVWLLQYDQGTHGTRLRQDAVDYSIRMEQFFDHYLKDAAPPLWMTRGIPAREKGWSTGYQLDLSGRQP
jgi:dipeptidyl aminopeptidase/acylaminoacyl peptidase